MDYILKIIFIGIGATIATDILGIVQSLFRIKSLNYRFVGRWIAHFPKGKFMHTDIMSAASKKCELFIGWTAHYGIGISFAFLTVLIYGKGWLENPELYPALTTGLITVLAPLFIMQPAFGFGIASAKLPNPNMRRIKSIITHIIYGMGLYLSALFVKQY